MRTALSSFHCALLALALIGSACAETGDQRASRLLLKTEKTFGLQNFAEALKYAAEAERCATSPNVKAGAAAWRGKIEAASGRREVGIAHYRRAIDDYMYPGGWESPREEAVGITLGFRIIRRLIELGGFDDEELANFSSASIDDFADTPFTAQERSLFIADLTWVAAKGREADERLESLTHRKEIEQKLCEAEEALDARLFDAALRLAVQARALNPEQEEVRRNLIEGRAYLELGQQSCNAGNLEAAKTQFSWARTRLLYVLSETPAAPAPVPPGEPGAPPPPPAPGEFESPYHERARTAVEDLNAAERRLSYLTSQAAEQRRQADEQRRQAEQQRLVEEQRRKAEQARIEEERRQAEQRRLEEQQRSSSRWIDSLDGSQTYFSSDQWFSYRDAAYHLRGQRVQWSNRSFSDGMYQVSVRLVSRSDDQPYGMCFRYRSRGNERAEGYQLLLNARREIKVIRVDGSGKAHDVMSWTRCSDLSPDPGAWNRIGVICVGSRITILVNGKASFCIPDSTYRDGGVGFTSFSSSNDVAYRNLEVDPNRLTP